MKAKPLAALAAALLSLSAQAAGAFDPLESASFSRALSPLAGRTFRVALMGDSFAAGEGSPNLSGARWSSNPCHRSNENGRSAALRRLQADIAGAARVPANRVQFIDVACSGATINGSILGENYRGVIPLTTTGPGPVGAPLDSQLTQVKRWLNGAPLDALVISVGGNDIGFGRVVVKCMSPLATCKDDRALETVIRRGAFGDSETVGLDFLKGAYEDMKARFDAELKPKAVYLVGVPNPVKDQDGRHCHRYDDGVGIMPSNFLDPLNHPFVMFAGLSTLGTVSTAEFDRGEAKWVEDTLVNPLNEKLASIASDFRSSNWKFVRLDFMTRHHGFCAKAPWFHTFKTSLQTQRDFNGIAHPNRNGYQVYDAFVYRELVRNVGAPVRTAPRVDHEEFHIDYAFNGERKILPPREFNLLPERLFIGDNWSVKFRTLVFPAADVVKSLALQVSTRPFEQARAADIRSFDMDVGAQQTGNFDQSVSIARYGSGQVLHVRWKLVSRPYWDANGAEQTKFSAVMRVRVKDGLDSAKKL